MPNKPPIQLWLPEPIRSLPVELYPEIPLTPALLAELKARWPGVMVARLDGKEILAASDKPSVLADISLYLTGRFTNDVRGWIEPPSLSFYDPIKDQFGPSHPIVMEYDSVTPTKAENDKAPEGVIYCEVLIDLA